MKMKNNLITIIVGNTASYQDGEIINIINTVGTRHIEELLKVARELQIPKLVNNELEMMKEIAKNSHAVILNYGMQNNKQSALVILPMQLSNAQIDTFFQLKEEFTNDYSSITVCAIPNCPLSYKGDLKMMEYEDKINGLVLSDVESLYNEINNHRHRLNEGKEINEHR